MRRNLRCAESVHRPPAFPAGFAALMAQGGALRQFETLQFEGLWDANGSALPAAIRRVIGRGVPDRASPWWLMRLLAPFGGFPREVVEIEPFWRHPMRMDNRRLVALLGREPRTPLNEAITATLIGLGCLDAGKACADATNALSRA